ITTAIIDGEAVVLDGAGVSRFSLLQRELNFDGSTRIELMAFDLLELDGKSVCDLPLLERKRLLQGLLERIPDRPRNLRYVEHLVGHGADAFAKSCAMGLEGIVSKRADRPYRPGRHGDWTKAKCVRADPFVVVGYTLQKDTDAIVGALVLGYYDEGKLVYAGRVGTGFSVAEARAMAEGLAAIRTQEPPAFAGTLTRQQRAGVVWIEPKVVAQVTWRDMTADGLLRHAAFEHLRVDKPAEEIARPAALARSDVAT
ncbi:MAG: non-homologous end-joining DNA ligase, partial [Proteobacteria bacterium]|nr:non-homologous end-joining DNA ligase [Pseudomonadota bacterium]